MPYSIAKPQLIKMNPMDILKDLVALKGAQQQTQMQEEKFKDWQETKPSPEEVKTGKKLELAEKGLTNEEKLLDIGSTKLKMLSGLGDYPVYRDEMTKMGFNPDLLPDTFESPEKFEDWRMKALMTAGEYGKMLKGEPFTLSRANPDGTISEVPITSKDQMQQFIDAGLLDPNAGWQLGSMKGTPGEKLPYKTGARAKFTGPDGLPREGTFMGLDEKGKPIFEDVVRVKKDEEVTGELTEGSVLETIRELVDFDSDKAAIWYNKYRTLYDKSGSRENALKQVMQELGKKSAGGKKDYRYLWEK